MQGKRIKSIFPGMTLDVVFFHSGQNSAHFPLNSISHSCFPFLDLPTMEQAQRDWCNLLKKKRCTLIEIPHCNAGKCSGWTGPFDTALIDNWEGYERAQVMMNHLITTDTLMAKCHSFCDFCASEKKSLTKRCWDAPSA